VFKRRFIEGLNIQISTPWGKN